MNDWDEDEKWREIGTLENKRSIVNGWEYRGVF